MAKKGKVSRGESGSTVIVDFGDTESRGGKKSSRSSHLPEGDYAAKVKEAKLDRSSEKETPGIFVTWVITKGEYKGKALRDALWLSDKALWRVRQTLEALGVKVPSKKVKVDPKKMIGKEAAITLEDEEYDGKMRSRVVDVFALDELEDLEESEDEDEDEEDEDEENEDEEDEDEDEVEDVDLDEI